MFRFCFSIWKRKTFNAKQRMDFKHTMLTIPEKHKLKFRNEKAFSHATHTYTVKYSCSHIKIQQYFTITSSFLSAFYHQYYLVQRMIRFVKVTVVPNVKSSINCLLCQQQSAIRKSAVKAEDCWIFITWLNITDKRTQLDVIKLQYKW